MAPVQLKQLTKKFGDVVAVDAIDLQVEDRELIVLVGPSGCGKTTTLRMIAGLEAITGGEIRIGDRVVNNVRPKDRDIAMVFQSYALYPHMTIHDNMAFGLRMRRTSKDEIKSRVAAAAEILDLQDLLHRKPGELSGGQQQRVAVGRAIVRNPEVFLFDEPLSNLDAKLRVKMRTELVKLHRRLEATMIYVTHDQVEAMMMGDRIVVMNEGRIQQVGTPQAVYEQPANRFVAEFVGAPAMNILPGQLSFDGGQLHLTTPLGQVGLNADRVTNLLSQDDVLEVWVGVRPEHVRLAEQADSAENLSQSDDVLEASAETLVAQSLGSETHVEFAVGGVELVARLPNCGLKPGEPACLCVRAEHLHLFDVDTESRLT